MKWDQIESKWALMTRRIRADWDKNCIETSEISIRSLKGRDAAKTSIADRQAFTVKESEPKFSAK